MYKIPLYTSKELDTMNVRYIDTGGWEITKPDGTKSYCRHSRRVFWHIRVALRTTAKDARYWMARARANPVSFSEFIPHYAEIIRYCKGNWQMLAIAGEWESVGTKARAQSALRGYTDLNPKEITQVLDYVEQTSDSRCAGPRSVA
jgi:hypothetical protein